MKSDGLRNFTVRFLESALRRVESTAKPFYGGRLSTGEAIRRLAEERLDEIESFGPRDSAPEALLPILAAWRSGRPLALDDLRFLARSANNAYQRCRQDSVSRELLVANVSAFRDSTRLLPRAKSKEGEAMEGYFLGNLRVSADIGGKTLADSVDRWIAALEDRPSQPHAEFASRNLWTYLRDEQFPDEMQVVKTLNPYVPSLLQVAIRGHWEREREPLIERVKGSPQSGPPARLVSPIAVDGISLMPAVQEYTIGAVIEFTERKSVVEAHNPVELEDLAEVTRLARTGVVARGGTFAWNILGDRSKSYMLITDRARWQLDATEFKALGQCLDSLFREPSVAALIERLRYVYGRI